MEIVCTHFINGSHFDNMELNEQMKPMNNDNSSVSESLSKLGKKVKKPEIAFIFQVIIIYIAIITCIINLSLKNGTSELWVSLHSYSLGCILPSPKIKKINNTQNNDTITKMERISEKDILWSQRTRKLWRCR